MEQVNVKINGVSYEVPADSTIYPHPLLPEGHQPDRRLPYVHGRSKGRKVPGGRLRVSCQRRHGGVHQHTQGSGVPQDDPGTAFVGS